MTLNKNYNINMKTTKLLFLFITAIVLYSCNDNSVNPVDNLQPGRRDYVWTVDTLNSPMNDLEAIWGSSPNDVWTVGPGGTAADRLFHFDGTSWTQNFIYKPANAYTVYVRSIWGTKPNDVYAAGVIFYDSQNTQRGFILHFDGFSWKEIYRAKTYSSYQRLRIEGDHIYIQGVKLSYTASDTTEFYQLNGDNLITIYSKSNKEIYTGSLNIVDNKVYFTIGRDIYRYVNGNFQKQLSINDPSFNYFVSGRSIKDIFIFMLDGLAHYNGLNFKYLYRLPPSNRLWSGFMLFKNEVYFNVYDLTNGNNYILSGKLKE